MHPYRQVATAEWSSGKLLWSPSGPSSKRGLDDENKLRIGLIASINYPVPPPTYGPLATVVDHLARGLQDAGHDVLLFAPSDSTCPVPRHPGLPVSPKVLDDRTAELGFVLAVYEELADLHFDIIHDHTLMVLLTLAPFPKSG